MNEAKLTFPVGWEGAYTKTLSVGGVWIFFGQHIEIRCSNTGLSIMVSLRFYHSPTIDINEITCAVTNLIIAGYDPSGLVSSTVT